MRIKILGLLFVLTGIWFLASAATTDGLLPSGHGTGRISEIIEGLALTGFGIYRLIGERFREFSIQHRY